MVRDANRTNNIAGLTSQLRNLESRKQQASNNLTSTNQEENSAISSIRENRQEVAKLRSEFQQRRNSLQSEIAGLTSEIQRTETEKQKAIEEDRQYKLGKKQFKAHDDIGDGYGRGFAGELKRKAATARENGNLEEARRLENVANKWERRGNNYMASAQTGATAKPYNDKISNLGSKLKEKQEALGKLSDQTAKRISGLESKIKGLEGKVSRLEKLQSTQTDNMSTIKADLSSLQKEIDAELESVTSELTSATQSKTKELNKGINVEKIKFGQAVYDRDEAKYDAELFTDEKVEERAREKAEREKEEYLNNIASAIYNKSGKELTQKEKRAELEKWMNASSTERFFSKMPFLDQAEKNLDFGKEVKEKSKEIYSTIYEGKIEDGKEVGESLNNRAERKQKDVNSSRNNVRKMYGGIQKVEESLEEVKRLHATYKSNPTSTNLSALKSKIIDHTSLLGSISPKNPGNYSATRYASGDLSYEKFDDPKVNRYINKTTGDGTISGGKTDLLLYELSIGDTESKKEADQPF